MILMEYENQSDLFYNSSTSSIRVLWKWNPIVQTYSRNLVCLSISISYVIAYRDEDI